MKIVGTVGKWLFALCVPLFLISASIAWVINSLWLYDLGAQRYSVRQVVANAGLTLTDAELHRVYAELIRYFNSGDEYVNISVTQNGQTFQLFNEEEAVHFKDVKGLFWLDYGIGAGSLLYILGFTGINLLWKKERRSVLQAALWGSGLTLTLMLVFGLTAYFAFDWLAYRFHTLVFSNLYWSAGGYMVLMLPGIFQDDTLYVAFMTGGLALLIAAVCAFLLRREKKVLRRPVNLNTQEKR